MRRTVVAILALLISLVGLLRMGFDTDILAMLPGDVPEVHGLTSYRDVLERGGALIVTLECGEDDAGLLSDEAESLSRHLKDAGVVGEARWRPVFEEDPQGLGELIAYLWMNGDSGEWDRLLADLEEGRSKAGLEKSMQRLGAEMDFAAMQMGARDPFGFFRHPTLEVFQSEDAGDSGYESDDGRMQLVSR